MCSPTRMSMAPVESRVTTGADGVITSTVTSAYSPRYRIGSESRSSNAIGLFSAVTVTVERPRTPPTRSRSAGRAGPDASLLRSSDSLTSLPSAARIVSPAWIDARSAGPPGVTRATIGRSRDVAVG